VFYLLDQNTQTVQDHTKCALL